MIPSLQHHKGPGTWPLAVGITLAVVFAAVFVWWIAPVSNLPIPSRDRTDPFISLQKPGGAGDMTMDQALLFDSAPLFLPTRWSTALPGRKGFDSRGEDPFELFASEISISGSSLLPPAIPVGDSHPALLPEHGAMGEFSALGRNGSAAGVPAFDTRGAAFEVRRADDGSLVLSGAAAQTLPEAGDLLWQPAEFWVMVDQAGPVGAPLVASGTGSDNLDAALRNLIMAERAIVLLPPGYYRVVIGP
ncbi:MAG TPA: hypothetical protein PKI32_07495 [Opitutales bacterium]|nr:hypothetical protein [Opitutales bacterium]